MDLGSWSSDGRMEEGVKCGTPERRFPDPGLFCKTQRQYSVALEVCLRGRRLQQHGGGEPGGRQGCCQEVGSAIQGRREDGLCQGRDGGDAPGATEGTHPPSRRSRNNTSSSWLPKSRPAH